MTYLKREHPSLCQQRSSTVRDIACQGVGACFHNCAASVWICLDSSGKRGLLPRGDSTRATCFSLTKPRIPLRSRCNIHRQQVAGQPELFWLDALGALQNVSFGAHGLASRFALSLLDNGFREGMSLDEARDLMEKCFRQLERRYLVSSVGFSMKVVDRDGCRDVACARWADGHGGGGGSGDSPSVVEQPSGRPRAAAPPVVARGGAKTTSIS